MGLLTHTTKREDLKPADHIYSWRKLKSYAHHGIYMGNDMVIHFIPQGKHESPPTQICKKCCDYRKTMLGDPKKAVDKVSISCLGCFLIGGKLKRAVYSVSEFEAAVKRSMTCFTATADPPEKVLERATSLLQTGFGRYNLLLNNCEDFAFYCRTGNNCPQGRGNKLSIASSIVAGGICTVGKAADGAYNNLRVDFKGKGPKFEGDEDGDNQRV
ncbi:hypothetical protein MRB53_013240 [Persea americana]|uniref:Uncharacterized protein n=1 Tax=Persea americana TaxID=3435 RepID=A0ACC2K7X1_PERAE|nr:hypothetical protein MRB53_013240 [Persea americana]